MPLVMLLFAFSCYKYTNYTNVIIIKALAFIASGISMFSFLGYLTSIGYIISNISNSKKNTTKNANSFFDDILNEMFNVVKMLSNMGKNLVGIGKKSKKNKGCKEPSMMGGGMFSLIYSFIVLFFMPFIIIPFMISTSTTLNLSLNYTYGFLKQLINVIKKIKKEYLYSTIFLLILILFFDIMNNLNTKYGCISSTFVFIFLCIFYILFSTSNYNKNTNIPTLNGKLVTKVNGELVNNNE